MEAGVRRNEERTAAQKSLGRWYWMPAIVCVLGVLSVATLIWIDQISQRQRMHFGFANALMNLRRRAAMSHLWLEESIAGGKNGNALERAWSDLREATRLSEILLNGGESEHGLIVPPLKDPDLRKRAEDLGRLLSEWDMNARERYGRPEAGREGSVLENRSDEIFDDLQRRAEELETFVKEEHASDYANSRRLTFGIILAWSSILVASTTGLWHRERRRRHAEEALLSAKDEFEMRVAERTGELRGLNEQLDLELDKRKRTEEALRESEGQIRDLSARLLTALETERRRIGIELHDEMGHALVVAKLRLGLIEKELTEDRSAASEMCKNLSQFIDQVIEDVRRLSRDLRPSVLEDLGLSAALRWLVNGCISNAQTNVEFGIIDVDPLVSRNAQVVIYRIIQEALTNVRKHAQAKRVSVHVERHGDRLSFVVEDDGRGFDVQEAVMDVQEAVMKDASERGFGLAVMQERARMLGGSLSVWSEAGKGSRITLDVPVQNMRSQG